MAKQAEAEFSKSAKEMAVQEQKIEKANEQMLKEVTVQQNLKKEKLAVEKEIHHIAKQSDELENGLNGYKENLKLAKEGNYKITFNNQSCSGLYLSLSICINYD